MIRKSYHKKKENHFLHQKNNEREDNKKNIFFIKNTHTASNFVLM